MFFQEIVFVALDTLNFNRIAAFPALPPDKPLIELSIEKPVRLFGKKNIPDIMKIILVGVRVTHNDY